MAGKPILAVGLDAGSTRTRCLVCLVEAGALRLLGYAEAQSQGWLKGRVADQNAVAESMSAAIQEAERCAQAQIESAVTGIGGPSIRGANSRSVIELGRPREVEQRDINRLVERASRVQLQEDRMVLQMFPQDFVVDDHPGHRDPRKMMAQRVEANVHLVTGSFQEHNCIVGAVNQANITVEETVFEGVAAAYAAVLEDDRREGVAVVDIGAHSSDLVVYYGESLQLVSSLPVSGDHFTRDVARGLCVSYETAELVKLEYGSAVAGGTGESSFIEVPAPGREPKEMPLRLLHDILEARAEELMGFVRNELKRVGMERALIGGLVLTGRASALPGLCELAERVLQCQSRCGLAVGIRDWPQELNEPGWTTAAGLAMYSGRLKIHGEIEKRHVSVLARILR